MDGEEQKRGTVGLGFWALIIVIVLAVAAAFFPPVRAAVLFGLTLPFRVVARALPGQTPYADALVVARILEWIGWTTAPLFALPLLQVVLGVARARGPAALVASLLRAIAGAIDTVITFIGDTARWAALALVLVVATIVVQRYVFGFADTKLQESVIYLHAALFLLVAASALRTDGHVRVDILYSRLGRRGRAAVNLLGSYLLLAPVCLVILNTSGSMVDASWARAEGSQEADGLRLVFVLKTLIPVFAVLILAQAGALAARASLVLTGQDPGAPGYEDGERR